ncbi:MAG: hypothetical protein FRX48_00037 [Lasallia pustulata]|uniref:Uncharacterized protein n=1 Tax=Lasallia pustulata TaxID=136370 RepID=A0A5M8Q0T0_9LECA|nr:MAG: hypothetical protein FRX48_00037 [Lasallia pustulata]
MGGEGVWTERSKLSMEWDGFHGRVKTCSFDTVTVHHRQADYPRRENLNPTIFLPARSRVTKASHALALRPNPLTFTQPLPPSASHALHFTPSSSALLPPTLRTCYPDIMQQHPHSRDLAWDSLSPSASDSAVPDAMELAVRAGVLAVVEVAHAQRLVVAGCWATVWLEENNESADGRNGGWGHWALQRD